MMTPFNIRNLLVPTIITDQCSDRSARVCDGTSRHTGPKSGRNGQLFAFGMAPPEKSIDDIYSSDWRQINALGRIEAHRQTMPISFLPTSS